MSQKQLTRTALGGGELRNIRARQLPPLNVAMPGGGRAGDSDGGRGRGTSDRASTQMASTSKSGEPMTKGGRARSTAPSSSDATRRARSPSKKSREGGHHSSLERSGNVKGSLASSRGGSPAPSHNSRKSGATTGSRPSGTTDGSYATAASSSSRGGRDQAEGQVPPSNKGTTGASGSSGDGRSTRADKCFRCLERGHLVGDCTNPERCRNCFKLGHVREACTAPLKQKLTTVRKPPASAADRKGTSSMVVVGETSSKRPRPRGFSGTTPEGKLRRTDDEGEESGPEGPPPPPKKTKYPYAMAVKGGSRVYILREDGTAMDPPQRQALEEQVNALILQALERDSYIPTIQEKGLRKLGLVPHVLTWLLPDDKAVRWAQKWVPAAVANLRLKVWTEEEASALRLKKMSAHILSNATVGLPPEKLIKLIRHGAREAGVSGVIEVIRITPLQKAEGGVVVIAVDDEAKEGVLRVGSQFAVGAAGQVRWSDPATRQEARSLEAEKTQLTNQMERLGRRLNEIDEIQHSEVADCTDLLAEMGATAGVLDDPMEECVSREKPDEVEEGDVLPTNQ